MAKCAGCGKAHTDVRRMVSLSGSTCICDECVDMCSEIVHEDGGFVKVSLTELQSLREQAHQAKLAHIWIEGVRESVNLADTAIQKND